MSQWEIIVVIAAAILAGGLIGSIGAMLGLKIHDAIAAAWRRLAMRA